MHTICIAVHGLLRRSRSNIFSRFSFIVGGRPMGVTRGARAPVPGEKTGDGVEDHLDKALETAALGFGDCENKQRDN